MADPHLNLFYSYNRSREAELIENNLTRAFIHTLRLLTGATRTRLLHLLSQRLAKHDFAGACFALQQPVKNARSFADKYVVTIATSPQEPEGEALPVTQRGESVPDAWIYDGIGCSYCLLIECKRGGNPLDEQQVLNHAEKHFGMNENEARACTVSMTWHGVLQALDNMPAGESEQESRIMKDLMEYLAFEPFGYRLFKGFRFADLKEVPGFKLVSTRATLAERGGLFHFIRLGPPPDFRLRTAAAGSSTEKNRLFRFEALGAAPAFRLSTRKGDRHGH